MAYEIEEIRLSQQIFYYLLEHFELREEEAAGLYRAYVEKEQVQLLVKSQGEEAHSSIERYGDVIKRNIMQVGWDRQGFLPVAVCDSDTTVRIL